MASLWIIVGGALFCVLGVVHAAYTVHDLSNPRYLVPQDPSVLTAMKATGLRIARGDTTMWRAWVGFNFSHGLGLFVFGLACVGLGLGMQFSMAPRSAAPMRAVLAMPVIVGLGHLWLAIQYWFYVPAIGVAAATLCFAVALWMY